MLWGLRPDKAERIWLRETQRVERLHRRRAMRLFAVSTTFLLGLISVLLASCDELLLAID